MVPLTPGTQWGESSPAATLLPRNPFNGGSLYPAAAASVSIARPNLAAWATLAHLPCTRCWMEHVGWWGFHGNQPRTPVGRVYLARQMGWGPGCMGSGGCGWALALCCHHLVIPALPVCPASRCRSPHAHSLCATTLVQLVLACPETPSGAVSN